MENNKKGLIFTIVILLIIAIGLIIYIFYDKSFGKNEKNNLTTNSNVNTQSEYEGNYYFNLNNKEHKITYKYNYQKCGDKEQLYILEECNFYVKATAFLDGKKINQSENIIFYDVENENLDNTKKYIKNEGYLSLRNIEILKGKDTEYLVLGIESSCLQQECFENPIILNENANLIHQITDNINPAAGFWYKDDNLNKPFSSSGYYIDNDKVIYLGFTYDDNIGDNLKYKVTITINNDKVNINKDFIDNDLIDWYGQR